jgi:hypothetical protein
MELGCIIQSGAGYLRNIALCLAFLLPLLSGCASIATSIVDSVSDSIICHHKCPGGSPEAEEKCREACKKRLAADRERQRRERKDTEELAREYEWKQKVNKQMDAVTKGYKPLLGR